MAVLLETSAGDLVFDLHVDLCPATCKNFVKLCKLKYYNNCMFHKVEKDFIAQSGDPTGTGRGGSSLNGVLYGEQARFFDDEITPKLTHQKRGTLSMASSGKNMNASQFFVTLRDGIDFLDGQHTVFGTLAEGSDVLDKINNTVVDEAHKPIKNIRIRHTVVLDDPFEDPSTFVAPDQSPVRVEDPFDEDFVDPEEAAAAGPRSDAEIARSIEEKQAHTRAVMLEMIGDLPDADIRPPENVLFVCKLNPNTVDEDLELIFSQFGQVIKCEVIRDFKTGKSLCFAFIEFERVEDCERAYFKMDNALIDDRRIKVDFSQSVSKLWNSYRRGDRSMINKPHDGGHSAPSRVMVGDKLELKNSGRPSTLSARDALLYAEDMHLPSKPALHSAPSKPASHSAPIAASASVPRHRSRSPHRPAHKDEPRHHREDSRRDEHRHRRSRSRSRSRERHHRRSRSRSRDRHHRR